LYDVSVVRPSSLSYDYRTQSTHDAPFVETRDVPTICRPLCG
jgi:hypothetical protein